MVIFNWNSGLFIWKASTILKEIARWLPDLYAGLMKINGGSCSPDEAAIVLVFTRNWHLFLLIMVSWKKQITFSCSKEISAGVMSEAGMLFGKYRPKI